MACVREDIAFLAGESCRGRETAKGGAFIAAQYIVQAFKQSGLKDVKVTSNVVGQRPQAIHNVIGTLPGNGRPVVIMARYDGLGQKDSLEWYPGADANASGVAAMIELAARFSGQKYHPNLIFAAVDAMSVGEGGADAVWEDLHKTSPRLVVSIDIIGSSLSPVKVSWPEYLIALGGERYKKSLEQAATPTGIHLFYDYYGSANFTRYFFVDRAPHRRFYENGTPCILLTSGITDHTNKTSDTPQTLDYGILEKRIALIFNWISKL